MGLRQPSGDGETAGNCCNMQTGAHASCFDRLYHNHANTHNGSLHSTACAAAACMTCVLCTINHHCLAAAPSGPLCTALIERFHKAQSHPARSRRWHPTQLLPCPVQALPHPTVQKPHGAAMHMPDRICSYHASLERMLPNARAAPLAKFYCTRGCITHHKTQLCAYARNITSHNTHPRKGSTLHQATHRAQGMEQLAWQVQAAGMPVSTTCCMPYAAQDIPARGACCLAGTTECRAAPVLLPTGHQSVAV
jgi:hypothetical protein